MPTSHYYYYKVPWALKSLIAFVNAFVLKRSCYDILHCHEVIMKNILAKKYYRENKKKVISWINTWTLLENSENKCFY